MGNFLKIPPTMGAEFLFLLFSFFFYLGCYVNFCTFCCSLMLIKKRTAPGKSFKYSVVLGNRLGLERSHSLSPFPVFPAFPAFPDKHQIQFHRPQGKQILAEAIEASMARQLLQTNQIAIIEPECS